MITKHFLGAAVVVATIGVSPSSFAEYTSYGVGTRSCGAWIEARKNETYYDMAQWMLGFVSATGYYGHKLKRSEARGMVVWMDNYCQKKPLSDFSEGVKALVDVMKK